MRKFFSSEGGPLGAFISGIGQLKTEIGRTMSEASALAEWVRETTIWIERLALECPSPSAISELELLIRQEALFARCFAGAGGALALSNILEQCNQCTSFAPEAEPAELLEDTLPPPRASANSHDGDDAPMVSVGTLEGTLHCICALIELREEAVCTFAIDETLCTQLALCASRTDSQTERAQCLAIEALSMGAAGGVAAHAAVLLAIEHLLPPRKGPQRLAWLVEIPLLLPKQISGKTPKKAAHLSSAATAELRSPQRRRRRSSLAAVPILAKLNEAAAIADSHDAGDASTPRQATLIQLSYKSHTKSHYPPPHTHTHATST